MALRDADKRVLDNQAAAGAARYYGRAGRLCRRCGTRILRAAQGPPGQERLRF
jgi:formamidopyrimidine-DNA glycosylase